MRQRLPRLQIRTHSAKGSESCGPGHLHHVQQRECNSAYGTSLDHTSFTYTFELPAEEIANYRPESKTKLRRQLSKHQTWKRIIFASSQPALSGDAHSGYQTVFSGSIKQEPKK